MMFHQEFEAYEGTEPFLEEVRRATSNRKLRLLACACARHIWPLITDARCRRAVEVAEEFSDGRAQIEELDEVWNAAGAASDEAFEARENECDPHEEQLADPYGFHEVCAEACAGESVCRNAAQPEEHRLKDSVHLALVDAAVAVAHAVQPLDWVFSVYNSPARRAAISGEAAAHRSLLRCIFGNPFRPVTFDPSWLTSTVVALAEGIYADRAFDRLPILADALEDAGCGHADILAHCRGNGPHARGCWVVDLLLGKE